jgi:glycosyltransferase involved in cell wall biosynthesis
LSDTKKKKLLVLSSTYPRWDDDWEPAFVHQLSKRLTEEFDVTVLCPRERGSSKYEDRDGVKIIRYRYAPSSLATLVSNGGIASNLNSNKFKWLLVPMFLTFQTIAIWNAARRIKPNAIHCHWMIPQGICLYIAMKFLRSPPPFLLTSHGGDLYTFRGRYTSIIKRVVINRANCMTVVSQTMKDDVNVLAQQKKKVSVIPMGIDTKKLFFPESTTLRSKTEVLFVGRLVKKKGIEYLIKAIQSVSASFPNVTLTIIGDGPELDTLKTLSTQLGVDDRTNFVGSVLNKDLPERYRKAAVFVAPFITAESGDQEGLGLVVAEALCCGCPVVVSDVKPVRDITNIIKNNTSLTLTRQKSSEDISTAIIIQLNGCPSQENLSNYNRISNYLDWEVIANRYKDEIRNIPPRPI